MKQILIVMLVLLLGGCASGYSQFYTWAPGASPDLIAQKRAAPAPAVPLLERSGDAWDDVISAYSRHGYVPIGGASFNSGRSESDKGALAQGAKVGADLVVVLSPEYAGSNSTVIPMTMPTTQTSYTSGSATAYGSGGSATVYGNSATTTYGTQTTYIPMTTHRYNYGALFFVKKKFTFGAYWRDLTDDERRQLQSNKGVFVSGVVLGTPAFDSDILQGDIILSVDGESVSASDSFEKMIEARKGRTVPVIIARGDARIEKVVSL